MSVHTAESKSSPLPEFNVRLPVTELEGDCVIGLGGLDQDCGLGVENDMGVVSMFFNCM